MPTPLIFDGSGFPGIVFDPDIDPPGLVAYREHFPGLRGEKEKRLGTRGRYIRYPMRLFDARFKTAADVIAFLQKCDAKVGAHGTLKETGNIERTFHHVTFEGCKQQHAPIPDYAGTLVPGKVVYHCMALLVFYQLTVQDDG